MEFSASYIYLFEKGDYIVWSSDVKSDILFQVLEVQDGKSGFAGTYKLKRLNKDLENDKWIYYKNKDIVEMKCKLLNKETARILYDLV